MIKAAIRRVASGDIAQMPFAVMRRGIALPRQLLRQRDLVARQPLRQARRHGLQATGADRMPAAHEGRAGRHAVAFHIEVLQQQAFGGKPVDVGRGRAAQRPAAIAAKFAPAQVVGNDQDDIGAIRHLDSLYVHGECPNSRRAPAA
ncbi:hypothetical protein D3C73_885640 [compost metagenome]